MEVVVAMKLSTVILIPQLAMQAFAAAPSASSWLSFWGSDVTLGTSNMDLELNVTFPSRAAYSFTSSVGSNNPTKDACGTSYTCAASDGGAVTPGQEFASTFLTEKLPTITWSNAASKMYTVLMFDISMRMLHWICLDVAAGTLNNATMCFDMFASPPTQTTYDLAWFPAGGPTTSWAKYGWLLFEQSASVTGAPASITAHGVNMMTQNGPGNANFNYTAFATTQTMTFKGSNWFSVKGNAYSSDMLKTRMPMFTQNANMFNCSTMGESYCTMAMAATTVASQATATANTANAASPFLGFFLALLAHAWIIV